MANLVVVLVVAYLLAHTVLHADSGFLKLDHGEGKTIDIYNHIGAACAVFLHVAAHGDFLGKREDVVCRGLPVYDLESGRLAVLSVDVDAIAQKLINLLVGFIERVGIVHIADLSLNLCRYFFQLRRLNVGILRTEELLKLFGAQRTVVCVLQITDILVAAMFVQQIHDAVLCCPLAVD